MANRYMKEAIDEAYEGINNLHGGPFGTVIVKDGKIIGRGHNCVIKNNDPTAHGEIMAIRDACNNINDYKLENCELYTTAEPCPMCYGAILWAGINKVYCGCNRRDTKKIDFSDDDFYNIITHEANSTFETVDRTECLKLFNDYTKIEERTIY